MPTNTVSLSSLARELAELLFFERCVHQPVLAEHKMNEDVECVEAALLEMGLRARDMALEEAARTVFNKRVDAEDTGAESDFAHNLALALATKAILSLKSGKLESGVEEKS